MPMTHERELWACADLVLRQHGPDDAPGFLAGRVTDLARIGDMAGVARWKAIADCVDRLLSAGESALQ